MADFDIYNFFQQLILSDFYCQLLPSIFFEHSGIFYYLYQEIYN